MKKPFGKIKLQPVNRGNKKRIQGIHQTALETDQIADQMSLKEFIDPFTGRKIPRHKSNAISGAGNESAMQLAGPFMAS